MALPVERSDRPRCRSVVFDLDDTLYLEREYVRSGFTAVGDWILSERSMEGFADRAWRLFEEGARGDIFNKALVASGCDADNDLIAEMVATYRRHRPSIALESDVVPVLEYLQVRHRSALISDGPSESQRRKVETLELTKWVETIILTSEMGFGCGKPSPAAFRLVESRLGAESSSCVYVGDNPAKDFVAPKSLGWTTVRVRRKGGLHEFAPSDDDVDIEIPDLRNLTRALHIE
jgi:putative hydrolase of the HAD superfamily